MAARRRQYPGSAAHRDGARPRAARRASWPPGAFRNSFLCRTGRRSGISSSRNATGEREVARRLDCTRHARLMVMRLSGRWRARFRSDGRSPAFAALPAIVAVLGLLALAAPLRDAEQPLLRVGALLALAGILEILHAVRRADPADLRRGLTGGALTLLMALLVINAPFLAAAAIL